MSETKPFLAVPTVRVSQPIGEFYLCSIPAEKLIQVSYSIPATLKRERGVFSGIFGNQRTLLETRGKQIGHYIDEFESTFPNTIILSVNYRKDGNYEEDESLQWHVSKTQEGFSLLTIPSSNQLASIIDGQHRLQGFSYSQKPDRQLMELPCAIFINLPRPYQAKIFATININQKRVDKSLAYQLFGYDLSESNADKWAPDMLSVYLVRALEGQDDSPFKGHVKLALVEEDTERTKEERSDTGAWKVSVACLVEGITRLISAKPHQDQSLLASGQVADRSRLPEDSTPLRNLYVGGKDKTLLDLIIAYFDVVNVMLWKTRADDSFITRTVGVLALFDLFREAITAGILDVTDMRASAHKFLSPAKGIDFSDDYFHASGAGRVRIRNVLKVLVGLGDKDVDPANVDVANRLKKKRGNSQN